MIKENKSQKEIRNGAGAPYLDRQFYIPEKVYRAAVLKRLDDKSKATLADIYAEMVLNGLNHVNANESQEKPVFFEIGKPDACTQVRICFEGEILKHLRELQTKINAGQFEFKAGPFYKRKVSQISFTSLCINLMQISLNLH